MKAFVCKQYGKPEVLQLKEVSTPVPTNTEVLIQIKSFAINTADWRLRKAEPAAVRLFFGFKRPKHPILGGTFSGVVVGKGNAVSRFQIGDEVIGSAAMSYGFGTFAMYKCLPENGVIHHKPANLNFSEAVAPVFGFLTAWHFLQREKIGPTSKVLIIGANGAVGLQALHIALAKGATVTAVSRQEHHEKLKDLGAKQCIENVQLNSLFNNQFDLIVDSSGRFDVCLAPKLMVKRGKLILVSAGILQLLKASLLRIFLGIRFTSGLIKEKAEALEAMTELMETKKLKPIIANEFSFEEMTKAQYLAEQKGKIGTVVVHW